MAVSSHRGLGAVCALALAAGCTDAGQGPTGPASLDHAPSASVTSITTHGATVTSLNANIATDDLIAGLIGEELPGDQGWEGLVTDPQDKLPALTDGLGTKSLYTGLMKSCFCAPTKRIRYTLPATSDVNEIRVLTGAQEGDARALSTFVIRYSTDGGTTYHHLGYFQSDPSGTINLFEWRATLVQVRDNLSPILLTGVTHLEFDFYLVAYGTEMRDPFAGENPFTGTDDGLAPPIMAPYLWEIDVIGEPTAPPNQPPTADAGSDQDVGPGAGVTLDGSGSSDPDNETLTYSWAQVSGSTVTLTDADQAVASFITSTATETLVFELTVCDPLPLCDTDAVTITVTAPITDVLDLAAEVSVSGPVKSNGTEKDFVVIVTNAGTLPATITSADLSGTVSIGGGAVGTVSAADGSKTLAPGRSTRFKLTWSYPTGAFARGDNLVFEVCIVAAGDGNSANDCGTLTVQGR